MFSFSGCSLVQTDKEKLYKDASITIGNTTFTKSELISQFYTYYQNNSTSFSYVSNDDIVQAFYTWVIVREIINQMATEELYDKETNKNGNIVYTTDDEDEIWEDINEYFFGQVSTHEKAIYKLSGKYEESEYPAWLQDEIDEDKKTGFLPYESSIPEVTSRADKLGKATKKLNEKGIKAKAAEIKANLNKFDGETIDDSKYIKGARNSAYARYIETLVSNAKSTGTTDNVDELFLAEVTRIYDAYYISKITTLFQNYYVQNVLLDIDIDDNNLNKDDTLKLGEVEIAKEFLKGFLSDFQKYGDENEYINTITTTSGASLILYHYEGQYYFFTVQHILLGFDSYMNTRNSRIPGYDTSNDKYGEISKEIKDERNNLIDDYIEAGVLFAKINKDAEFDNIEVLGDYYYYNKEAVDDILNKYPNKSDNRKIDEEMAAINYGYLKASTDISSDTLYFDLDGNGSLDEGEEIENYVEDVDYFYMATIDQVLECFKATYSSWTSLVNQYISASEEVRNSTYKEIGKEDEEKKYSDLLYIFEMVDNMLDTNCDDKISAEEVSKANKNAIYEKLASMIFVELEWIYSADSLGNEFSNKLGYVVSSEPDNQGSWVTDFSEGARKLLNKVVNSETGEVDFAKVIGGKEGVAELLLPVYSQYGVHIMKVENIFTPGSTIVDMKDYVNFETGKIKVDLSNEAVLKSIIVSLKNTYVCASSNQTLYNYYFDKLYVGYAGNNTTNGTYFLAKEYEWLSEYYGELQADGTRKNSKITFHNIMSYDELMAAING